MSELIRLLSKDTGGSRHYTGWGENTIANHSGKMLGLQTQSEGKGSETKRTRERREDEIERRGRRQQKKELEKGGRAQNEVMALMHVLPLCVTLGLRRGRRAFQ